MSHGDRRLHASLDAELLQEVLQSQAVHDRTEHAHVVGTGAVHPPLVQLGTPEEVAAADDDRDLDTVRHHIGDLAGDRVDDVGVHPELPTAEDLTGQLEDYPGVRDRVIQPRWGR